MEWVVVLLFSLAAAAMIALPRSRGTDAGPPGPEALREERTLLLAELRELDDDRATGRISAADRLDGRRALGPRLRAVTEALQELGGGGALTPPEPPTSPAPPDAAA